MQIVTTVMMTRRRKNGMETNHIELPNAGDKVKILERRLDMLEQIVAQLD